MATFKSGPSRMIFGGTTATTAPRSLLDKFLGRSTTTYTRPSKTKMKYKPTSNGKGVGM